ncbi:unnamed protein product [Calypogeia fissa]
MNPSMDHTSFQAPGDVVLDLTKGGSVVRLGRGLRQEGDSIVVTRPGRLWQTKPNKYWVEGSQKRYVPNVEDGVLGVVTDCREAFSVDIGASVSALLPRLSFEGATRRNAPNLQVGALVYARVVKSHRDINPEMSCMDVTGKSAGFGLLKGGYLFECSTGLARALLSKRTCPVLEALGKSLSYEIAVGLNGRVWVTAESPAIIVAVSNAISNAELLSPAQQHILVQRVIEGMEY